LKVSAFANGQSMDIVFDAANALIDDVNKGEEFREFQDPRRVFFKVYRLR
jgi:hypothetical protein